ncbi:ferredoxin [Mycolicibacterium pulveris]|nr:ferredoxin [Mycolicibacterium pulveris]MCV6983842.1 ferredoxin [Mycolicibacterium pulveris]
MRVSVDRTRCAGHAVCLIHAPAIFDIDDDGYSVVLDPTPSDIAAARRAEENCPERAINLEEEL